LRPPRLVLGLLLSGACVSTTPAPNSVPATLERAEQLVVVTTPDWDSTSGTLRRFVRANTGDEWRADGAATPIVVGRTGLAWGRGFDAQMADAASPHKREGDGRSPAGVFPLDTAFGFAPADSARWVRLPYVQLTPGSDCVDDTLSAHYNTVVDRSAIPLDWSSAEHMRQIAQYRIGVIVGYNAAPPTRGRGSCIFLHIWSGPGSTTAGCTALDAQELSRVMAWLDRRRRPVIVQLPAREYGRLQRAWRLPAF
jgi:L,D-peptidoglycan transpeptidase YkuD (ErfK/YbiS/YcfS/YnhG family)